MGIPKRIRNYGLNCDEKIDLWTKRKYTVNINSRCKCIGVGKGGFKTIRGHIVDDYKLDLPPLETIFNSVGKIRILYLLAKFEEMNISRITTLSKVNHRRVKQYLEYLKEQNIVQEKRFGRIQILKINVENDAGRIIKEFLQRWP